MTFMVSQIEVKNMKLNKIHHVAIICSNYELSKKFYTEILGLRVIREIYRKERDSWKCDLEACGEFQRELFSFPNPPGRTSRPEACGLRHLAFEVDNIDETITELKARGVEVEPVRGDETRDGKKVTFFTDTDGMP